MGAIFLAVGLGTMQAVYVLFAVRMFNR